MVAFEEKIKKRIKNYTGTLYNHSLTKIVNSLAFLLRGIID